MMIFEGFYHIRGMAVMWVTQISKLILVFSDTIESVGTKFHLNAYGCMGMKIYTNE